jgi:protein-S-isoprenylcysteine O-methyltransferase Ste14
MRFPKFQSKSERIISYISVMLFTRGLIILTIFIPIDFHLISFLFGTLFFFLCLSLYGIAIHNFLSSDENEPVTKGMYKLLRHPMQILAILMWIGVGIATWSWLIISACIIQFFISYPFWIAQERECLEVYGEKYEEYLNRVKRYYFI